MSEWPKIITYYLHSDEEYNWDIGRGQLGLSDEAMKKFAYCCYEIGLTLEVHEDGTSNITHIEGKQLAEKIVV